MGGFQLQAMQNLLLSGLWEINAVTTIVKAAWRDDSHGLWGA